MGVNTETNKEWWELISLTDHTPAQRHQLIDLQENAKEGDWTLDPSVLSAVAKIKPESIPIAMKNLGPVLRDKTREFLGTLETQWCIMDPQSAFSLVVYRNTTGKFALAQTPTSVITQGVLWTKLDKLSEIKSYTEFNNLCSTFYYYGLCLVCKIASYFRVLDFKRDNNVARYIHDVPISRLGGTDNVSMLIKTLHDLRHITLCWNCNKKLRCKECGVPYPTVYNQEAHLSFVHDKLCIHCGQWNITNVKRPNIRLAARKLRSYSSADFVI